LLDKINSDILAANLFAPVIWKRLDLFLLNHQPYDRRIDMKHIRSLFPTILLLLSILFAGTAHSKERVNVVYSSISGLFLGCWVAQEAGYFDREGLQVNLIYIQGASTAIKA
jgi:hypothetical protein